MFMELNSSAVSKNAKTKPWANPKQYWEELTRATNDEPAPVTALNLAALHHNAADIVRRAGGIPVRVASKSIRVKEILETILKTPGFKGVLAYTLEEALWLANIIPDILVAYPSVSKKALATLAADETKSSRITIMVDSPDQLDIIDAITKPGSRNTIRVCLDFDASWQAPVLGNIGVYRSPIHEPNDLLALAEEVMRRPGFQLVGVMSYEAQIAGVGNEPADKPILGKTLRFLQHKSAQELAARRKKAIKLVNALTELEFVNGGGTGSLEKTASEGTVTEVAAGSGLFGPHLFDNYQHFKPAPAVAFALDVVRKPRPDTVTVLGGGWVASGVSGNDRLPKPVWPQGLKYAPREGAGEVQTPLLGKAAYSLNPGDRVWLRHTKSGEIMEHVNEVNVVLEGKIINKLPTYRGEGKAFL